MLSLITLTKLIAHDREGITSYYIISLQIIRVVNAIQFIIQLLQSITVMTQVGAGVWKYSNGPSVVKLLLTYNAYH